jgi:hypothetical protein
MVWVTLHYGQYSGRFFSTVSQPGQYRTEKGTVISNMTHTQCVGWERVSPELPWFIATVSNQDAPLASAPPSPHNLGVP